MGDYALAYETVQNFEGQNVAAAFASDRHDYGGAQILTKVDYAIVIAAPSTPPQYVVHLPIILKGARLRPW